MSYIGIGFRYGNWILYVYVFFKFFCSICRFKLYVSLNREGLVSKGVEEVDYLIYKI